MYIDEDPRIKCASTKIEIATWRTDTSLQGSKCMSELFSM